MNILKFGGTSLGSAERMKHVARLVISTNKPKIVVLSAVAGTTDDLVKISEFLIAQENEQALKEIKALEAHYHEYVKALFSTEAGKRKGDELTELHFNQIRANSQDLFTTYEQRAILAHGELISTALLHFYLEESGQASVLLPALDFMRLTKDTNPDQEYIRQNLNGQISHYEGTSIFITQGYICRNTFGEIDNLKRGGSDYSASLIGAAVQADEIQIWTDIDGMHNNDPRHVKNTNSIKQLSFDEAAELAYFGAKVLHPSSILPARQFNIPVRLLNTLKPELEGTLITSEHGEGKLKAVAAKDGITAIKVKSSRMLLAYGFLRRLFEIFERYQTPIDMIATSEIAVSLSVDDHTHLKAIKEELGELGEVEIDSNQTIICVVGDFVAESKGVAATVLNSLNDIPVRMISYGGSRHNISLLVATEYKIQALNELQRGLFDV